MKLEISTTNKFFPSQEVSQVLLPTEKGESMILPGHAPLIAQLGGGPLSFQSKGETKTLNVSGGIVKVRNDQIVVACDEIIS